jgi:two-component system sensor histidine kinase KdpD
MADDPADATGPEARGHVIVEAADGRVREPVDAMRDPLEDSSTGHLPKSHRIDSQGFGIRGTQEPVLTRLRPRSGHMRWGHGRRRRYGVRVRGSAAIWAWGRDRAERAGRMAGHLAGLVGVCLVTGLIALASGRVNELSMGVCYQLLVLAVSVLFGIGPGLSTSLASAVAFNLFFIPPTGTLTIGDEENWVSLAVFAATALVTSQLAAGARSQRRESEARLRDADLLAGLAETILGEVGPSEPGPAVESAAARALGVSRCAVALAPAPAPGPAPAPTALRPDPAGFAVPLVVGGRVLGLLEVGPALPDAEPRWARPGFATAVAGLAAVAVERSRLIRAGLEAESLRRSDELKTALLHGVSHEFRTPITAIRTAAHALRERPGADAEPLLAVMSEETARLDRLVRNLLDLSRLEAGALVARMDWCAPAEIAAGAIEEAAPLLDGVAVQVDVPLDLPLVRADAVLAERILVNLLHNAARHGAAPVRVAGRIADRAVELAVADGGRGVDPAIAARLFHPFASGGAAGGTGIGLALSRGLAEAQGAALRLDPGAAGTRFVLAFPLVPAPEVVA